MLLLALLLISAVASACRSVPTTREMQRVRVQEGFGRRYTGDVTEEFYVAPRDAVQIQSLNYEELNLTQQIGPDGRITIPLIGDVKVAGMTPRDIESTLMGLLSKYMKKVDLVVVVNLKASKRIYLVTDRRGTTIPFTGDLTAWDIVLRASFSKFADLKNIRIIRADPNDAEIYRYNHEAMLERGDSTTNIQLREDDIVYIPLTPIGQGFALLDKALEPVKLIGAAVSTILRGALIPAYFSGFDQISERIEQGRVGGEIRGQNGGSIFF